MNSSVTISSRNGICAAKFFRSAVSFGPKANMTGLSTMNSESTFVLGLSTGNGFL